MVAINNYFFELKCSNFVFSGLENVFCYLVVENGGYISYENGDKQARWGHQGHASMQLPFGIEFDGGVCCYPP